MAEPPSPNPYMTMRLAELASRCMKAAGTLEPGKVRTPEQRAKLAERVRLLLIPMAWRISGSRVDYRSPESLCRVGKDPGQAFADYVASEQRALRRNAFQRCAEEVLGPKAAAWMRVTTVDGRNVVELAAEEDGAFLRALGSIPDSVR